MTTGRVLATQQARDAAKQLLALTGPVKEQMGRVLAHGEVLADPSHWEGGLAGQWRHDWGPDASHLRQTAAKLDQLERRANQAVEDIFKADAGLGSAPAGVVLTAGASALTSASPLLGDLRSEDRGREDRRIRNDEITRTPEGGRGRGDWLDSDWSGREILERYLDGGGDWTINNDPQWNKYMMDNHKLANDLNPRVQNLALALYDQHSETGQTSGKFDDTFHEDIENGEGIVGYQYLHGTRPWCNSTAMAK